MKPRTFYLQGGAGAEPRIETTLERSAAQQQQSLSAQNVYPAPVHRGANLRSAHSTPAIATLQVGQAPPTTTTTQYYQVKHAHIFTHMWRLEPKCIVEWVGLGFKKTL